MNLVEQLSRDTELFKRRVQYLFLQATLTGDPKISIPILRLVTAALYVGPRACKTPLLKHWTPLLLQHWTQLLHSLQHLRLRVNFYPPPQSPPCPLCHSSYLLHFPPCPFLPCCLTLRLRMSLLYDCIVQNPRKIVFAFRGLCCNVPTYGWKHHYHIF